MRYTRDILIVIVCLVILSLIGFLLLKPRAKTVTEVPVVIEYSFPQITKVSDTIYIDSIVYKDRIVYRDLGVNKELERKYLEAKDSIAKLKLHLDAITERKYSLTYTDSTQEVNVHSWIRGKLIKQNIDYTVFPKNVRIDTTVSIEQKEKIRLWGKASLRAPLLYTPEQYNPFMGKADVVIKNKRNQLYELGIDSQGGIWLGFGMEF